MKKSLFVAAALFLAAANFAQNSPKNAPVFSTRNGAIDGFDAVAYFTGGKATRGKSEIQLIWKGAIWHFASAENRQKFEQMPEKYAPQYGGWCAYGWSQGYPAKIEGEAWSIVEGKLYLNYDLPIRKKWLKKQAAFIEAADANWAKSANAQ